MDVNLQHRDTGIKTDSKPHKSRAKPWWNQHLQNLWSDTALKEKLVLKHKGPRSQKRRLHNDIKLSRAKFDREYRHAKRKHLKEKQTKISEMRTDKPKYFWDEIHKQGRGV